MMKMPRDIFFLYSEGEWGSLSKFLNYGMKIMSGKFGMKNVTGVQISPVDVARGHAWI